MSNNHEPLAVRRVLILDFDGVVVDTERVHFESWNAAIEERFGVRLEGDYKQVVGLTLDELLKMWTANGSIPKSVFDSEMQEELLARKTEYFFKIGADRLTALPHVAELVHKFQTNGWYAVIASRGRRMRLLKTLEMAQIPAIFELVLGSDDIVDSLTDRKVHSRAATMLGADPANCIVVEDSPAGVADARASGIGWVVGLTTSAKPDDLYDAGANQVISSLADLDIPSLKEH